MIFVLSGEGPTDIGLCSGGQAACGGREFRPGPMALIIECLVKPIANYSVLEAGGFEFVSEGHLKTVAVPRSAIRGKKRKDYDTAPATKYFYHNARQLARIALDLALSNQCPVGAVLFRDTDGTRSTEKGLYEHKWKSIEVGFQAECFDLGVPMVPKPKSEAWLLCALQTDRYQDCARLETALSGNDNNPNSAKDRLADRLRRLGKSVNELAEMVREGDIDATRIQMPSFNRFRVRLEQVTRALLGLAAPGLGRGA